MTKEEALKLSIEMLSPDHREYTEDIHKNFIDIVYYDFEYKYKTLSHAYENEKYWRSHYESKCGVCGTCKYFHDGKYPDDRYCDKDISMCEEFSLLERNFGCNLWEKKNERD